MGQHTLLRYTNSSERRAYVQSFEALAHKHDKFTRIASRLYLRTSVRSVRVGSKIFDMFTRIASRQERGSKTSPRALL